MSIFTRLFGIRQTGRYLCLFAPLLLVALSGCSDPVSEHPDNSSPSFSGGVAALAGGSAGFADGIGTAARFDTPSGIVVDYEEKFLYVADTGNGRIRKIEIATREVTTLAEGFDGPRSIVQGGDKLYVADESIQHIHQVDMAAGVVSALGIAAGSFAKLVGLAIDPSGNTLYGLDGSDLGVCIREIDVNTKAVTERVGSCSGGPAGRRDGPLTEARFAQPRGMGVVFDGKGLLLADGDVIRFIDFDKREVSTIPGLAAGPHAVGFANFGTGWGRGATYIADGNANRIKHIVHRGSVETAEAVDSMFGDFIRPIAITTVRGASTSGDRLYVADGHRIRMITTR